MNQGRIFTISLGGGGFPVITCSIGGASRRLSRSDFANTNQELT